MTWGSGECHELPQQICILAYFEDHGTLIFAPICRCFEFVKQCFTSHLELGGQGRGLGASAPCPSVEPLLEFCVQVSKMSERINLFTFHVLTVNNQSQQMPHSLKVFPQPSQKCNTLVTRFQADVRTTSRYSQPRLQCQQSCGFICDKINAATTLQALAGLLQNALILFHCTWT